MATRSEIREMHRRITEAVRASGISPVTRVEHACFNARGRAGGKQSQADYWAERTMICVSILNMVANGAAVQFSMMPIRERRGLDWYVEQERQDAIITNRAPFNIVRIEFLLGIEGRIWLGERMCGESPTNDELALTENWG